ncbi:Smr/MutS family protein [Bordetella genomosp. 12]|uniref:DNA mismatch repair protein MutS n=1 Tax=Bordetella genomosp. 12 TaxID=463035 RepID=A0A261VCX0_9BORD|nr:Smr/MutS family protein [Bordetella genomosp. 12]OZI71430.1 DNA mismatch repair protein MutS [Bordetella genomosp. 12]
MRGTKLGLADLKKLQKDVQQQQADAQRREREAQAARARAAAPDDVTAFRRAMGQATPIKACQKVVHAHQAAISPAIAQRRASATGEAATRADQGVSDGGDIAPLLSENGTAFVRHDAAPDTARNLKRGQWRAGAEVDLHGLRVEQARHAVLSFLDECLEHGIRCVRIVHGKGYGSQGLEPVLKDKVRTWLVQKKEVMAFSEASEREGGAGALLVLMRTETPA